MGKGIFEIFVCMVFFFFSIRKSVIMDSMSKEKKGKETENQIEEKRSQIKISVRNLVEFIFREGDIDNRHGQSVSPEAMLAGSRMHRRIQKRMGSDYHAEVPLKLVIGEENYDLVLEGRADGIQITSESEREIDYSSNFNSMTIEEDMNVVIDEIKGVYLKLEQLAEPVRVHKAQAMCYAYIFALQHDIERIGIQMTYVNLDTEEIKYFHEDFTFAALEEWFDDLIRAYKKWSDFQYAWRILRQESIQKLQFPFPYRKGQKELAAGVYRTIKRKKNLFIQAPTGVGKTIATLFPAVKAVGEGLGDKIFYLTAKTITRTVAWQAFETLREQALRMKVIVLTAKDKICFCEETNCNPDHCPYAKGHFDRVNDAVFDLLQKSNLFTREEVLAQAKEYQVCPFEMSLDVATWADNIVCDYNYVFDPNVYLKRFFQEGIKGDYLFLVDEAHNLVDRSREMYSADLYKEDVLAVKRIMKAHSRTICRILDKCNKAMLEMKRECEHYQILDSVGTLTFHLMRLASQMDEFLEKPREFPEKKTVLDFYFALRNFLNIYDLVDDHYVIYSQMTEEGQFRIRLFCVDPSVNLQKCIDKSNSTIFFSATLLPIGYYKRLLSTDEDNYAIYAQSTFAQTQRLLAFGRDVSTKYTRRNRKEYEKIADYIGAVTEAQQGNYMVFFPSYRLMQDVYEVFAGKAADSCEILMQHNNMKEHEREAFLEEFEKERQGTLVAFCVMGGIFGEGIDLKNDRLIGAIIVGTGLPQVSDEREILKNYYAERGLSGFDYAFRYPGMNKVLQAAGRVIRTSEDRGVILLLDERFLQREYGALFPREWEKRSVCGLPQLREEVSRFWSDVREEL